MVRVGKGKEREGEREGEVDTKESENTVVSI